MPASTPTGTPARPHARKSGGQAPDVVAGDRVFARHPQRGPIALRVTAVGRDGFTARDEAGAKHGVPFADYLGHQARKAGRYDVVQQGADGAILRDASGATRYLAGEIPTPPAPTAPNKPGTATATADDPLLDGLRDLAKALQENSMLPIPANVRLMLKAGPIANRPNLQLKEITDKAGHQTHRWMGPHDVPGAKPAAGAKPAMKHGDSVGFQHGDVAGKGKIVASGQDGVTLQDDTGREQKVRHEHLTGPEAGGGGEGGDTIPDKSAYPARNEGESDKAYLKRNAANLPTPKLPEAHGRYFNMDGKKTKTVPIEHLVSTKSDEENEKGGNNSPKFMAAAAAGVVAKRDPINVKKRADGKYDVTDGNGTFTGAKAHGWKTLPVQVDDDPAEEGAAAQGDPDGLGKPLFPKEEVEKLPHKDTVVQPFNDEETLFDASHKGLDYFKSWLNRGKGIASAAGAETMTIPPEDVAPEAWDKPGAMLFIAPVKGRKRAKEKVEGAYGGNWNKLKDTVRGSIAVDSLHDLHPILDKLRAGGLKLAQKPNDRFAKATDEGYRDLQLIVDLPGGLKAELQLHVKEMLKAKNEGHHYYEISRVLTEKQNSGQQLTDDEKKSLEAAVQKQKEIYAGAWQAMTGVSGGAGGTMTKAEGGGGFRYYDKDGAKFRGREGEHGIREVLHGEKWVPYDDDCWAPVVYGDRIPDPLGGGDGGGAAPDGGDKGDGGGASMSKADGPRLLLPTGTLAKATINARGQGDLLGLVPKQVTVAAHTSGGHKVEGYTATRMVLPKVAPATAVDNAAATPTDADDDTLLLDGLPSGTAFERGRGPLNNMNWKARLPDGVGSNYFPTKRDAAADARQWWANHGAAMAAKEKSDRHHEAIRSKLRAGQVLTDGDIAELGLRPGKKAGFDRLSPLVQRLFGVSRAKVRESMGDALERRHTDGGTEYWVASPRKALANAATWAGRMVQPPANATPATAAAAAPADTIIIKQAGPYTVTSDGDVFYVNGRQTPLITASGHLVGTLAGTLDTGRMGANGKRDVVGISSEHMAAHRAFGLANGKSLPAAAPMSAAEKARVAAERAFDAGYNEGGEGYNPHRNGSRPTYSRNMAKAIKGVILGLMLGRRVQRTSLA